MLREELDTEELQPVHRIDHEHEARAAELPQHALLALPVADVLWSEGFLRRGRYAAAASH